MEKILTEVAKSLEPDKSKNEIVEEMLQVIKSTTSEEILLGGSFAKQTHIGEQFDCDIFVRFKENGNLTKTEFSKVQKPVFENLSDKLEIIVKEITKELNVSYERVHGSRDYFQINYKDITFELIPVLLITDLDMAENIMDYSPFHVSWVKKELEKQDVIADIRLFKQFLKANNLYGAESYIKGFSGHICDILILFYKGFPNTIKEISKWKIDKKPIIDYENFYKGRDVLFYMNESKAQAPIIIVDPIVKERNAAAALGNDVFTKAIAVSKAFIKNPSTDFFSKKELTKETVEKNNPNKTIISLNIEPLDGKKDIVGSKMLKTIEYFCAQLEELGFGNITFEWEWNKVFLIAESTEIEKEYLRKGPEVTMTGAIEEFKKQHKDKELLEQNGRLFAKDKRAFTSITLALKTLFRSDYIAERVKNVNLA